MIDQSIDSRVDIIVDDNIADTFTPPDQLRLAVQTACTVAGLQTEPLLCIRFASNHEVQQLNSQWRGRDSVTDVLSFPMQQPDAIDMSDSLGDIALAMPFVQREADRLGLALADHIMHLLVHATLHLLGYDHIDDGQALQMQQLERSAMQQLGLHDPYPELET
ncbi:MAG: rRNA maturation RNase YbeY [Mariprofundus sp.]